MGETLVVGGRFFPQAEAGINDLPREAWIDFYTNDRWARKVFLFAWGHTVQSQAAGDWLPPTINFGFVDIHLSNDPLGFPTTNALIESHGLTPLLIQALVFEDDNLGFSWSLLELAAGDRELLGIGQLYQIDPGDSMLIQVRFVPQNVGPVETRLIAQTNAGQLQVRLLGEGVHE